MMTKPASWLYSTISYLNQKTQARISQYFIRGRTRGWSMVYISQSYFGIPKTIRNFPSDMDVNSFIDLYKRVTSEPMSTMMIDIIDRKIYHNVINFVCKM
ncbi:TPA: hypothetical protein N0F65_007065 [Lagenidium giganteum]|uniref:Uncharacterized protein n=1 Tax=Lagenidium giganteum TaxID=4803 RepID=A0AAV2YTW1_9STRA|nr:TPA: hypothetical protein N0F65_007065 [Lagenidium giganteum]